MTQMLTTEGVKAACREAYNAGRLLAQTKTENPAEIPYGYEVDVGGAVQVCAIGACLTRESLDEIVNGHYQCTTLLGGCDGRNLSHIFACSPNERWELVNIQTAHDDWLRARMQGMNNYADTCERTFLELIHE